MKRVMIGAALLVMARAELAAAGSCGGSSGGGSSSGGSSSGGSSSSDSSSYSSSDSDDSSSSSTPACVDDTDIVGYRQCTKYGKWGSNLRIPQMIIELGTGVRSFSSPLGTRNGTMTHEGTPFAYRVVSPTGPESSNDVAMTMNMRFGFGSRIGLYVAADLELGKLVSTAGAHPEMIGSGTFGSPSITQSNAFMVSGLGVLGLRGGSGKRSYGIEAAGGARVVGYEYESRYLACQTEETLTATQSVLELRARASTWLTPFVSAGAMVGASVIDKGDWMGGIYLGVHTHAYGGSR